MIEVLKFIGWAVLTAFGSAVFIVIMWFVIGLIVCFYKIHFKKNPVKKVEDIHIQECYKGRGLCDCPGTCRENC